MDTTKTTTHIGLCAGYGGIELGLKRVIPNLRSVALCEIEAFAVANLVAKMEAGLMDPAPIWPDLKTFPWEAFRDRVDILTGGYPCQPFSSAGKRAGKEDPRHLWPWIADGVRLLRPKLCFFENVEGHISLGLSDVIEDLAGMGYRTTWGIFSASEVGAPHQRKRVFILAHRCDKGLQGREWFRETGTEGTPSGHASQCNGSMAVTSGLGGAPGLSGSFPRDEGQSGESDDGGGQDVGNAISQGVEGPHNDGSVSEGVQSDSIKSSVWPSRPGEQQYGWEPPRVVSGLEDATSQRSRCEGGDALHQGWTASEAGTESVPQDTGWQDGTAIADDQPTGGDGAELADSHRVDRSAPAEGREHDRQAGSAGERQAEPPLGGDADGAAGGMDYAELCVSCDNRTDELRLLGNGVVPATAERAFRVLIKELYTAPAGS
jgi:DNA (cytosine-5)-methyltransferase 1